MSKIKVNEIEKASGSGITVPTGTSFTITDGLASGSLPTVPVNKGGTNLTSFTAGDILYATGSTTLAKLAKGTAAQRLAMNAGATAPEWVTASGGGILQAKFGTTASQISTTNNGSPGTTFANMSALTGITVTITPASTNNKILVFTNFTAHHAGAGQGFAGIKNNTDTRYSGIVGDFYHPSGSGVNGNLNVWWLDTPTTTNATTYQAYYGKTHSGTDYINRDYYSTTNNSLAIIGAFEISSGIL